jgi:hypothetical protein
MGRYDGNGGHATNHQETWRLPIQGTSADVPAHWVLSDHGVRGT